MYVSRLAFVDFRNRIHDWVTQYISIPTQK